jgi:predicted nucleic acid-binding Zn ribbon protein
MGAPEVVDLASISAQWERLVGPDIAAHARPSKLKDDVLTVSVDHPAWASELRLLAAQLVQRLRQEAGSTIKSVTVQVGL